SSPVDETSSTGAIEVLGVIKWFDVAKGYGFIVPDNVMPDVLLHGTCLRRDGYQTAYEGARVVCEALAGPKGLQAFRIITMDESTAVHPAQMPPPRTHVTVAPTSGLERAQVKWFNRLRGFGFLTRGEGTPDIFVHMETLRRFGLTELRPGQYVLVRFGPGPKGLMAAEVRPEGAPLGPASHCPNLNARCHAGCGLRRGRLVPAAVDTRLSAVIAGHSASSTRFCPGMTSRGQRPLVLEPVPGGGVSRSARSQVSAMIAARQSRPCHASLPACSPRRAVRPDPAVRRPCRARRGGRTAAARDRKQERRARLRGRDRVNAGGAGERTHVPPPTAGRAGHAVRLPSGTADQLLDEEHLYPARHDLHPRRRAH